MDKLRLEQALDKAIYWIMVHAHSEDWNEFLRTTFTEDEMEYLLIEFK